MSQITTTKAPNSSYAGNQGFHFAQDVSTSMAGLPANLDNEPENDSIPKLTCPFGVPFY